MTTFACRTLEIARGTLAQARDGDTIQLVWRDANAFSRAAVESQVVAMGIDVFVVVAPAYPAQEQREEVTP